MASNMIEGIVHSDPNGDETSGCKLVETLEKNLAALRVEARQVSKINSDVESKLRDFDLLSDSVSGKLQSLMTLSELGFGEKDKLREFVEEITLSWLRTNRQIIKENSRIRVASKTANGAPLQELLEINKKETGAIKISLQIGSVIYDQNYVNRGFKACREITELIESLENCDDKVQQYMTMCKSTPYLLELSSTIDRFVANLDLSPSPKIQDTSTYDLSVFRTVSKLLTGELLGENPTNPRQVLLENAPRKPVFITLNTRRKIEAPKTKRGSKIFL